VLRDYNSFQAAREQNKFPRERVLHVNFDFGFVLFIRIAESNYAQLRFRRFLAWDRSRGGFYFGLILALVCVTSFLSRDFVHFSRGKERFYFRSLLDAKNS
jgi:hypothetical protein